MGNICSGGGDKEENNKEIKEEVEDDDDDDVPRNNEGFRIIRGDSWDFSDTSDEISRKGCLMFHTLNPDRDLGWGSGILVDKELRAPYDRITTYKARYKKMLVLFTSCNKIYPGLMKDSQIDLFLERLEQIKEFDHRNISKLIGVKSKFPNLGFLIEYASMNLYEYLLKKPSMKIEEKISLFVGICEAMIYLTEEKKINFGIYLSPNNIYINDDDRVKLNCANFGLITDGELSEKEYQFQKSEEEEKEEKKDDDYKKDNIYSFGMVMRLVVDNNNNEEEEREETWIDVLMNDCIDGKINSFSEILGRLQ